MNLEKELKRVKKKVKRATYYMEKVLLLQKQLELERIIAYQKWFEQYAMKELLKAGVITQEQLKESTFQFQWDENEKKEEK